MFVVRLVWALSCGVTCRLRTMESRGHDTAKIVRPMMMHDFLALQPRSPRHALPLFCVLPAATTP